MKKLSLLFLLSFSFFEVFTQSPGDTIIVKSFNYNQTYGINQWSSGIRDTIIDFSQLPNVSFEKVIMKYNIRCKNSLISNSSSPENRDRGCGEWDASCNTYIHDSSRIDSIKHKHPNYTISNFKGSIFNYTNTPTYEYFQHTQNPGNLNSIINETQHNLLNGNSVSNQVLNGINNSGKSQHLYTSTELNSATFPAGNINGILIKALNAGLVKFLRVSVKHTTLNNLSPASPETKGFTEVYFSDYNFTPGSNRIQFSTPFAWNGTDNIIIEFSFTNTVPGNIIEIEGTSATGMSIHANNGYNLNLSKNTHIEIPPKTLPTITNEITISFWARGNLKNSSTQTSIIHANDANGDRSINLHLPWDNGHIYWDAGSQGKTDRIEKAATTADLEGKWNHWAVTKNAVSGEMKIYLNGTLWHSGTGNNTPIEIDEMIIGKSNSLVNNYQGQIDELRIWDKELSEQTIFDWMNKKIEAAHPQYSNLIAYFKLDEGSGALANDASKSAPANIINDNNVWKFERGINLSREFISSQTRPNITLLNGTYDYTSNPTIVTDSTQLTPNTVRFHSILSNAGTTLDDEVLTDSILVVFEAIPQNVYDGKSGALINTIGVTKQATMKTAFDLEYYKRSPSKYEILSFVTPYGLNLDLGPKGKTWTFDMTDYLPIFKGLKRMTIEGGGQWMEDIDIKFLFIVGTPVRDVIDINQLWFPASRPYRSIINNDYFSPIDVQMNPQAKHFKVRTAITGHGQQGEFIPQFHYLNIDGGGREFAWRVWKECAENPIYPQGGTWIYDRAGWCPSMATDVQHKEITNFVVPGQTSQFDYGITSATGTSNYIVNSQLVSYGDINHTLDASLIGIQEPSNRVEFERFNSICNTPKVLIKNTGSEQLSTLTIKYWINNAAKPETFNWSGKLDFLETELVELPSPKSLWSTITGPNGNVFHAEVSSPNGAQDEYSFNNTSQSRFELPEVFPSDLVIWLKTNNTPNETSYELLDETGAIIHSRKTLTANTDYKDTLNLGKGCYSLRIKDTDDDGIRFWANSDGPGHITLYKSTGGLTKLINGDFGDGAIINFTVDFPLSYEEITGISNIKIYPNPAQGSFTLKGDNLVNSVISVYDNLGRSINIPKTRSGSGSELTYNTESIEKGIYFVHVNHKQENEIMKLVIQ